MAQFLEVPTCCARYLEHFFLAMERGAGEAYLGILCERCRQGRELVLDFSKDDDDSSVVLKLLEAFGKKSHWHPTLLKTRTERLAWERMREVIQVLLWDWRVEQLGWIRQRLLEGSIQAALLRLASSKPPQ